MSAPTHCTNPDCRNFSRRSKGRWYRKYGRYHTAAFGYVQRYICISCNKTFSTQTFSIDYYVKCPVDYAEIHQRLGLASGARGIGRAIGISHSLVMNRIARLNRSAMQFLK